MKKILSFVFIIAMILTSAGCSRQKQVLELPFEASEVERVRLSRYAGEPDASVEKEVTEREEIEDLWERFHQIPIKNKNWQPDPGSTVYSFVFCLSDHTEFEIRYLSGGVKHGRLVSTAGAFDYFTSADMGGIWTEYFEPAEIE